MAVYAYLRVSTDRQDVDNQRYGMVRGLISLQDEINKRRSKALHLLSVHQVIAEKGAVQDVDKARRELARPDGFIEVASQGMRFEVLPTGELAKRRTGIEGNSCAVRRQAGNGSVGSESRD